MKRLGIPSTEPTSCMVFRGSFQMYTILDEAHSPKALFPTPGLRSHFIPHLGIPKRFIPATDSLKGKPPVGRKNRAAFPASQQPGNRLGQGFSAAAAFQPFAQLELVHFVDCRGDAACTMEARKAERLAVFGSLAVWQFAATATVDGRISAWLKP